MSIYYDLSLEISPCCSEPLPVEIEYISHQEGADILGKPAGIDHKSFPDEMGLTLEIIKLTSHSGTHIDAPIHYGPTTGGMPAKNIADLPLSWFFSDGVVLDCLGGIDDGEISEDEIIRSLEDISYKLKPLDIVLLRTGADKQWGQASYFTNFRGVSREAIAWLIKKEIKVVGVDTFGFDAPFHKMLNNYCDSKDQGVLWPAHFYGREKEYCQIERLANLNNLPRPFGFKVSCFPIKVKNCGAGWARVVAIYED